MTLLREIQNEAIRSDSDVLALLRKCRVLAARLHNQDLKGWVGNELDGYSTDQDVPSYRKTTAVSKGHFGGAFGSGLRNAEIPPTCLPKEFRGIIRYVHLREGIGAYCDLLKSGDDQGVFTVAWPADLYPIVGTRIYERMNLMQAWQEIGRGNIVNIIETVKTRILNFVLEIEAEFPDVDHRPIKDSVKEEKVQQIFNTYITGNVGNLASGSSDFSQKAEISIQEGNVEELLDFLKSKGVSEEDAEELKAAIEEDESPPKDGFGPKVSNWIGRMVSKAASGAWQISTEVAVPIVTKAIRTYYGIGG